MIRIKERLLWKKLQRLHNKGSNLSLVVPASLQPFWIKWKGYGGPWIENYFSGFWDSNKESLNKMNIDRTYIPIWWTDCYHRYGKNAHREIQEFLDKNIKPAKKYFTIIQNDDGIIESMPENVLRFAAGGSGDIPIPLLKGNLKPRFKKRDILCSFMGEISGFHDKTGVRSRMFAVLHSKSDFYFAKGSIQEFVDISCRSIFVLCPRGYGRTSFRLYEAMDLEAIPIYIWDDLEWLPYKDKLDWNEFAISINIKDIEGLPQILATHTPEIIKKKQGLIRELHKEYFTLEGACNQIIRILAN